MSTVASTFHHMYVCLFIINPVGSMIHPNRKDKYSFDTNNLANVSFPSSTITQMSPIVKRLQASQIIVRRRVPSRITNMPPRPPHSVRNPTTASMRPVQTTHDPVCLVYTTGRGHTAVRQQFARQLDIGLHVVVLCNAATHTVPSSQLQPSTQANVSLVLYGLRPDRRCSPGSVATVRVTAAS